ncbi:MAG TPA: hypothetical protein ENK66_04535 [Arcobacter sp.]|nr:hypothetical protein [Arcobacter sp.]
MVTFEAIEIKLDKPIDATILRIAKEKIVKFSPKRYYILSYFDILSIVASIGLSSLISIASKSYHITSVEAFSDKSFSSKYQGLLANLNIY